jgi:hypothetical protein
MTEQDDGKGSKAPTLDVSRASVKATLRRLAKRHQRSLEILEAYEKGKVDRPHVR